MNGQLISVQVGQPKTFPAEAPHFKQWRSAIGRLPVSGAVYLGEGGLEGDRVSDPKSHGGPFRAVNVYPAEHYEVWRLIPGLESMTCGSFGENFTTLGLLETNTCIGDVFRVGEAVVEVTQPRGPCYKLNRRWHIADLQERAEQSGRIGWYFRVRQVGMVAAGNTITRLENPFPQWTVARVWALRLDPSDQEAVRQLSECPALAEGWRASLLKRG